MRRLFVCSEPDLPSRNMKEALIRMGGWEDAGSDRGFTYLSKGDDMMVTIPDLHIRHESLDAEVAASGFVPDEVIFMSKHAAKSGQPALTVHPIGNYKDNQFGGKERTLVPAAPASMTDALRRIVSTNDMAGTQTCFEVTHHGPWLEAPTFFIEIGSDESNWGNVHAAEVLAQVISDLDPDYESVKLVGVGGGHYAPRFTEVALRYRASFGHMVPGYQLDGADDGEIVRMVSEACAATDTHTVYIHRKSMKKSEERRISDLMESAGFEIVTSSDLEPIDGSLRTFR